MSKTLKRELIKQLLTWSYQLSQDERKAWRESSSIKLKSKSDGGLTVLNSIPLVLQKFDQLFAEPEGGGTEHLDFLQPSSPADCAVSFALT